MNNDKSSIFLSLFKRKGSVGVNTRIIDDNNKVNYQNILTGFEPEERGLILCYWDNHNWTILTNKNLRSIQKGIPFIIRNSEIIEVRPALEEEYNRGVTDKKSFTLLKIIDRKNQQYILNLELGLPYSGFYQVLHYITCLNK